MPTTLQPPSNPFAPYSDAPLGDKWLNHLLRRAAFGPTSERLEKWSGQPAEKVLDWLFNFDAAVDPFAELVDGLEGFVNLNRPDSVASYWLYRMLHSPQPLQERAALLWHCRFATSAAKVERGRLMHEQIQTFRTLGLGSFRDLTIAVTHDPAMLIWLDGQYNRKGKPNENYAREVMELFTLGIGNYSEADVKELARAFTGWRVEGEKAFFDARQFDAGEKQILGKKGNFDSESAIDVLLAQPAAPRHLARNLLAEFVHPEPLEDHIAHYADRITSSNWQVKPVLRELLASRLFFSDYAYRSRIKSPVELLVGASLALGGKVSTDFLRESCIRIGQSLLYPPNVKGWPGEEAWINANTMLLRFNVAMQLTNPRQQEYVRRAPVEQSLAQGGATTPPQIVDHFARLLLDGELSPETKQRLLDYMQGGQGERLASNMSMMAMTGPDSTNPKVRGLLHLMMSMPEYQLA